MVTVYMAYPVIHSLIRNVYVIPRYVEEPRKDLGKDWVHVARCEWDGVKRKVRVVWFDPKGFDVTKDNISVMSAGSILELGK
jgi:hypothetical protein